LKKAWHWVKKNSRFVLATIGAIVTGGFLAPLLLGAGGLGLSGVALAVSSGAAAGAVSGAITTGTIKGTLKGALFGGITAGAAYGVAELTSSVFPGMDSAAAHSANFLKNGLTKVTAFKTLAHGLARGAISKFQGGSFKAGFFSGLSSGLDVGNTGYGNILVRTGIMAIGGGTFSVLGGGKFSNGAFAGAMTHLYNAEMKGKVDVKDNLKKAYDFYKSMDTIGENIEMAKYVINLGKALNTNNLNLAAESYANLYEYIPVPVSIVPVNPVAITNAINNIQNYQTRQMDALRQLCGNNQDCIQHYSN
jgi:hypothetical protein